MADDSTVNAGLLGFAQIHVRDSNRAEPYWSTTFTQSMYLGVFRKNRNRLIRIQQLSDDVVKNVPRNCQTRALRCHRTAPARSDDRPGTGEPDQGNDRGPDPGEEASPGTTRAGRTRTTPSRFGRD